jgi:hypothetical protein
MTAFFYFSNPVALVNGNASTQSPASILVTSVADRRFSLSAGPAEGPFYPIFSAFSTQIPDNQDILRIFI